MYGGTKSGLVKKAQIASPSSYGRFLHAGGKGCVTLAQKTADGFVPITVPCEKLAEILPPYGGEADVYLTLNTFRGPRRVSRVLQLRALYIDLDYYKIADLADMQPLGVLEAAFEALEQARIPRPSIAIDTGRGLALIWRHEPAPSQALPRWKSCQKRILEVLKPLGADPSAIDAARVLRLAGTHNSKSGKLVQAIWEDIEESWDFENLADEVLPYTRRQIEELRAEHAEKRALRGNRTPSKPRQGPRKGFTVRTLNQKRMSDLNRLIEVRGWEKLPSGERDEWMFVAGVVMSYLVKVEFLERELIKLGREKADWSETETKRNMQTVISRAHDAAAGEQVEWAGRHRDTRYRLTNEEIIRRLSVTSEEEEVMETILSEQVRKRRERVRKEKQRRSEGIKPRAEYISDAEERNQYQRVIATSLRSEGMSLRQIARELDISHTHVSRLLKSSGSEDQRPVTRRSVI